MCSCVLRIRGFAALHSLQVSPATPSWGLCASSFSLSSWRAISRTGLRLSHALALSSFIQQARSKMVWVPGSCKFPSNTTCKSDTNRQNAKKSKNKPIAVKINCWRIQTHFQTSINHTYSTMMLIEFRCQCLPWRSSGPLAAKGKFWFKRWSVTRFLSFWNGEEDN